MMVAAMTWPAPKILVSVVPDALTAAVSFFLVARIGWPADLASVDRRNPPDVRQLVLEGPSALSAGPRVAAGYV
jgi:hypothetical protein